MDERRVGIRIGVMCNGRAFPAWQARVLRSLLDLEDVDIALLIIRKADGASKSRRLSGIIRDWRHLIWTVYNKGYVERRSAASRSTDLTSELADVDEIRCSTIAVGKYGERFVEDDIETIRAHDLDVIIRFSFGILKGEILESSRFGIWSFHHGDERRYRGQPPGFWELCDGSPVVGSILQRITERLDGGTVLHRGTFRATPHSYRRTRDDIFFGAADFPSIVIRQILDGDTTGVESAPSTTTAPLRRSPGNLVMLRFLALQAVAFIRSQWRGLTRASKWSIGVVDAPISTLLDDTGLEVEWVLEQGRDRYLADPFPDPTGRTGVILVEDFDHAGRRGVISAIDTGGDRRARLVLDTGVHASYPYLFEAEGEIYCTPETSQAAGVRLYRASRFPDRWELVTTIIHGAAALDPTVIEHDGRWWLFCTLDGPDANTKLHVFHATALSGPWAPHRLNPVKTDIGSSRPGGTPFFHAGHLYRPAQDSSTSYGGGVAINRVEILTPTRFAETTVRRVPPIPGRYADGIHTISNMGQRTIVDGRRDYFNTASFRHELAGRFRRFSGRG